MHNFPRVHFSCIPAFPFNPLTQSDISQFNQAKQTASYTCAQSKFYIYLQMVTATTKSITPIKFHLLFSILFQMLSFRCLPFKNDQTFLNMIKCKCDQFCQSVYCLHTVYMFSFHHYQMNTTVETNSSRVYCSHFSTVYV